jgi:hypothetical protein
MVTPVLALALGACAGAHHAQPAPAPEMPMPQPTAEHKRLLEGVGTWEGTLTNYMPGAPPQSVAAKEVVEPIGEFWTQSRFTCDFMGMPYLGTGVTGYDARKKKYIGTWTDNMSGYFAFMEGDMDASGKRMVMHYEAPDMTGAIQPHRIETVFGTDSYTSSFYMGEGAGTKVMTIEMKRRSGGTGGTR